jgi:hypothetical protein
VRIAKGSEAEVISHFIDARDLKLLKDEEFTSRRTHGASSNQGSERFDSISRINTGPSATTVTEGEAGRSELGPGLDTGTSHRHLAPARGTNPLAP